jgi:uncharacterized repeat protein (TIGR01451 family)
MKNKFTLQLLVTALLFFVLAKTSSAQSITFELLQQPCNNDGVLVIHTTGISLPVTFGIYNNGWVNVTVNSADYTLNNYSGAPFYVSATNSNGQGTNQYYNGSPPFTYSVNVSPAVCPALGSAEVVNISGGQAPFTMEWFDESNTILLETGNPVELPAGALVVRITDANGCVYGSASGGDSIYIWDEPPFYFNVTSTIASCTNGSATAEAPIGNGVAPYTYLWSNGAVGPTAENLVMGYYDVTATDAQGCSYTSYAYVNQTPQIGVNTTVNPATCLQSDGDVWAFGSGGLNPYTYLWSDGQTTQHATGLSAGYYQVVVTDANGCLGQGGASVNASTPITVTYSATTSLCTSPTGTATVVAAGGTLPYAINWSIFPNQSGTTATNLLPGNYSFNVTDAVGCVRNGAVTVPPVSVIAANAYHSDALCTQSNGVAGVTVTSGTPPYTYLWNTGSTNTSISSLAPGGYSCTITDNMSCAITKSASVGIHSPISLYFSSTPASCIFTADASVSVTAFGGTPPYTYYWSNGATTTSISGTGWGHHVAHVQDAQGCTASSDTWVGYNQSNDDCYCTLTGTVYHDENANCVRDNGEEGIQNIMIRRNGYGGVFTEEDGTYSIIVPTGNYTLSENIEAFYPLSGCQNNSMPVSVVAASGCTATVDFANTINPIHSLGIYSSNCQGPPVVGNPYTHHFIVKNEGTLTESTIQMGYENDGQLSYLTTNPNLFTQLNTTLEPDWYSITSGFPALTPGATQHFSFNYNVPTNIPLGTSVVFEDTVVYQSPMSDWINDYTPWNNVNSLYTNVVSSYDPNNKEVNPRGYGEEGQITHNDSILTYTIHFQNTGTWPAQNIYLIDTLPATLNLSTLRPVYSNHDFTTSFTEDGVVRFQFDNINLPDSASQPLASIGYVIYTIHLQPGLPFDTRIENFADIYFDYNAPIRTNTALNTIVRNVGVAENEQEPELKLYPNPSRNAVTIETAFATANYQLVDITGKTLLQGTVPSPKFTLDISSLSSGVYFISVSDDERQVNGKVVKE